MSDRRITRNRVVAIIGGCYKGMCGMTIERSDSGDWLINFKTPTGNFEDWVALKHIKPPA
jgi:hypothetical protein